MKLSNRLVTKARATRLVVAALIIAVSGVPGQELRAQQLAFARAGFTSRTPPPTPPARASLDSMAMDANQRGAAPRSFRPVGTVIGALVGALYGGLSYAAAGEAGDDLFSFSNHRFPKAIAIGAGVGLLIDLTRHLGPDRSDPTPR